MIDWRKGAVAGAAAGAVTAIPMAAQSVARMHPEFDLLRIMGFGLEGAAGPALGLALHLLVATALGAGFAAVVRKLPFGTCEARGVAFAVAVWLTAMMIVAPAAGAGLFALDAGMYAPLWSLGLHTVFGATLGFVFARRKGHWRDNGRPVVGALRYTHY